MAKIFEGIKGYAEMTAEEKLAALEGLEKSEAPDFEKEIERYKQAASKANSEAADYKRKLAEKMTEDERKEAEREEELTKLKEEVAESRRRETVAQHKARYSALGFNDDLASTAAEAMANGQPEEMFNAFKTFLDSHDKNYRDQLMRGGSEPPAGNNKEPDKTFTREQIESMTPDEINANWDAIQKSL
ncbi:MAG: hypothetical protein IJK60_05590 [Clostridia bacterium]|nr:hypothetical protein [Clostridia bacterium]